MGYDFIYLTDNHQICTIILKEEKTEGYKFGTTAKFTQLGPVTWIFCLISGRGKGKQNCSVSKMVDHK